MYVCTYVRMYVCMYVCVCMYMYIYLFKKILLIYYICIRICQIHPICQNAPHLWNTVVLIVMFLSKDPTQRFPPSSILWEAPNTWSTDHGADLGWPRSSAYNSTGNPGNLAKALTAPTKCTVADPARLVKLTATVKSFKQPSDKRSQVFPRSSELRAIWRLQSRQSPSVATSRRPKPNAQKWDRRGLAKPC